MNFSLNSASSRNAAYWFFSVVLYLICSSDNLKTPSKTCFSLSPPVLLDSAWTQHSVSNRDHLIIELDPEFFPLQLSGCSSMVRLLLLLSHPFFPTSLRGDKLKCCIDFFHFSHCCLQWLAGFGCITLILVQSLSLRHAFSAPCQIKQPEFIKDLGVESTYTNSLKKVWLVSKMKNMNKWKI